MITTVDITRLYEEKRRLEERLKEGVTESEELKIEARLETIYYSIDVAEAGIIEGLE